METQWKHRGFLLANLHRDSSVVQELTHQRLIVSAVAEREWVASGSGRGGGGDGSGWGGGLVGSRELVGSGWVGPRGDSIVGGGVGGDTRRVDYGRGGVGRGMGRVDYGRDGVVDDVVLGSGGSSVNNIGVYSAGNSGSFHYNIGGGLSAGVSADVSADVSIGVSTAAAAVSEGRFDDVIRNNDDVLEEVPVGVVISQVAASCVNQAKQFSEEELLDSTTESSKKSDAATVPPQNQIQKEQETIVEKIVENEKEKETKKRMGKKKVSGLGPRE
ncbi:glycine-rich RNA-binding protein 3, mitochondrial [Spinacia oleracea]|uniref:Glycine-rich RNA-binding protein 3, mitochondrial n=1 Tax=Spinacia oleracea TaxID=3562 RepID=A0ABM3QY16_SPIOL|nr:glycine-rich RNA-binding protein 3, mitochondrial-like [Spinacia oleracea]